MTDFLFEVTGIKWLYDQWIAVRKHIEAEERLFQQNLKNLWRQPRTRTKIMAFDETTFHIGYKDHRCEWCGETIPKGEKFAHCKGKWRGEWQNWRMHQECQDAHADADPFGDGFMPFGNERGSTEEK